VPLAVQIVVRRHGVKLEDPSAAIVTLIGLEV
jgi:hypothetical protein